MSVFAYNLHTKFFLFFFVLSIVAVYEVIEKCTYVLRVALMLRVFIVFFLVNFVVLNKCVDDNMMPPFDSKRYENNS